MMATPGQVNSTVGIQVDVDDAAAQTKLLALGARLSSLDNQIRGIGKARGGALGDMLGDMPFDELAKFGKELSKAGKILKQGFLENLRTSKAAISGFVGLFGGMVKIIKFGAIELGVLSAVVATFHLTLMAGQYIVKGWNAAMSGVGAAAGVAVAGIATVFAALRELQVAQMQPAFSGNGTMAGRAGGILGSRELAMFDQQTLAGIMQQQMASGNRIDASFERRLTRLGDFTGGDAKTLQSLNQVFNEMQKAEKVTTETFTALKNTSPALAKAFEELAGGEEKASKAAAAGKISYEQFFNAVMTGNLEALKPYDDALENINDTLIGRLKGNLVEVREDLIELGEGFLYHLKGPLEAAGKAVRDFLFMVTPTLNVIIPQAIDNAFGGDSMSRFATTMANFVNTNLPKLIGFGGQLRSAWGWVKDTFASIGDYLERMTTGWGNLWNGLLKPLFQEIWTTFNFILEEFNTRAAENADELAAIGDGIRGFFNFIRELIVVINDMKPVFAFFANTFLKFFQVIGNVMGAGGLLGGAIKLTIQIGLLIAIFNKFFIGLGKVAMALFKSTVEMVKAGVEAAKLTAQLYAEAQGYGAVASAATNAAGAVAGFNAAQMGATALPATPRTAPMGAGFGQRPAGVPSVPGVSPGMHPRARAALSASRAGMSTQAALNAASLNPAGSAVNMAKLAAQAPSVGAKIASSFAKFVGAAGLGVSMGAGLLGTLIQGAAPATSAAGQGAGGALQYGSMGAMIGTMIAPGIGTALGAAIGGVAGLAMGITSANEAKKQEREERRQEYANELERRYADIGLRNDEGLISGLRQQYVTEQSQLQNYMRGEGMGIGVSGQDLLIDFLKSEYPGRTFTEEELRNKNDAFVKEGTIKWLQEMDSSMSEATAAQTYMISENAYALAELYSDATEWTDAANINFEDTEMRLKELAPWIEKLTDEELARSANLTAASDILGVSMGETIDLFNEMGISLSKTGLSISRYMDYLGYTNDELNNYSVTARNAGDALKQGLQAIKDEIEINRRQRDSLTTWFETAMSDDPKSTQELELIAIDVLEQGIDQQLKSIATGDKTFREAFGFGEMGGGDFGKMYLQLVREGRVTGGRGSELAGITEDMMQHVILPQIERMQTDPFELIKYDAAFGNNFQKIVMDAERAGLAAISGGATSQEGLSYATAIVQESLSAMGFDQINPETMMSLIGSGMLEQAALDESRSEQEKEQLQQAISDGIVAGYTGLPPSNFAVTVDAGFANISQTMEAIKAQLADFIRDEIERGGGGS